MSAETSNLRTLALRLAFACLGVGLGLVIACSFRADEMRRYFAAGGLILLGLGGLGLFVLKGRQARSSVQSWTGPAAVGFVVGVPIIVGIAVYAYLHL